jgi:hypothetical protein
LCTLETASGRVRDLTPSAFEAIDVLTWSPDGTHIAFEGFKAGGYKGYETTPKVFIYAIRADGSGLANLARVRYDSGVILAWRPLPR